jgi:hypothetical protein
LLRPWILALHAALLAPAVLAAEAKGAPTLDAEHVHPSGRLSFRTPSTWTVRTSPTNPDMVEAGDGTLLVRFEHRDGEVGYDSLHVLCMLQRLASEWDQDPRVKYEYDFLGGEIGNRRALDSAFVVTYTAPIAGYREWRQRNVTLVGGGQSVCAISYAPLPVWKKSPESRALLDAVLQSLTFR